MNVFVIPDIHLKPWIFERAIEFFENKFCDQAVVLMGIPGDWGKTYDIESYVATFDKAIEFAKAYPQTLWVYGNHELGYNTG